MTDTTLVSIAGHAHALSQHAYACYWLESTGDLTCSSFQRDRADECFVKLAGLMGYRVERAGRAIQPSAAEVALERLDTALAEAESDWNSDPATDGETYATVDVSRLRRIISGARSCQCGACDDVAHASDCAVHNTPALPVGPCDCPANPIAA